MSNESMFHELCDDCGKSLFMIHPDEQFNCHCVGEAHTQVFIFQEDEDARMSSTKLKDLEVGDSFVFMGKRFTKTNEMGWLFGVCNITDDEGQISHLHPTTYILLIH